MLLGPFVVQFVHNQYAVFVAESDEVAAVWIVRGTNMVHSELLHQLDALLNSLGIGRCTEGS